VRVGIITDELTPTHGWGRHSIEVIRALLRAGASLRLLSPRRLCEADDLAQLPGHTHVSSYRSETRGVAKVLLRNAPAAWRALRDCDAVHALTEAYAPLAVLSAHGAPAFVTVHGTYGPLLLRGKQGVVQRWALRRLSGVVCVSRYTEGVMQRALPGVHTAVVPNGVDLARFAREPDGPPAIDVLDGPFVLSVGAIKERKGYHTSIPAFAQAHARFPDVRYVIVGDVDDRPYLARMQALARDLGVGDAVCFAGRVSDDDLVRLYHRCAAFWQLPSVAEGQFEGFGLMYLEANACGKPVIGAAGCGAEEPILDGENGFLVPADDPAAAAEALCRLLADPALAARMGERGRARAASLTWDAAASRLLEMYRRSVRC
jgi:glycosyltransferase involved in cell wall biosynthesis